MASGDPDGFEGNAQTFRILTRLSLGGTGDYLGLNLTRATLAAVEKYPWPRPTRKRGDTKKGPPKFGYYAQDVKAFDFAFEKVRSKLEDKERTLEAQIMDWADDITYAIHDIEDFYRAGWIPLDRLRVGFQPSVRAANEGWADELKSDLATLWREPERIGTRATARVRLTISCCPQPSCPSSASPSGTLTRLRRATVASCAHGRRARSAGWLTVRAWRSTEASRRRKSTFRFVTAGWSGAAFAQRRLEP